MEAYQQRIVEEKNELCDRLLKLEFFIKGDKFSSLPLAEQSRLSRQRDAMTDYLHVLQERICAFPT